MIGYFFVLLLLFLLLVRINKSILNSVTIVFIIFVLNFIGLILYDEKNEIYFWGILAFVCGVLFPRIMQKILFKKYSLYRIFIFSSQLRSFKKKLIITFILLIIFSLLGFLYYSKGIPIFSDDPDHVRFEQQNIPFFGFLYRINYWTLPYLTLVFFFLCENEKKNKIFCKILLSVFFVLTLVVNVIGGSKGAIIHVFLLFLLYFSYKVKVYNIKYNIKHCIYFSLVSIFSFLTVLKIFQINSGANSLWEAIGIFLWRITLGASEGIHLIINDYTKVFGYGLGWFSFIKPIYTLLGTLKIIDKSSLTIDSGAYIANYYRGEDNLAPFTYTILGEGFLDFGEIGLIFYGFLFGILLYWNQIKTIKNADKLKFVHLIAIEWLLITLASWGYIDGWISFGVIYIVIPMLLIEFLNIFIPTKLGRSMYESKNKNRI